MTHYSENPYMVRVDFFKPSGKWYMTEAWDMRSYYYYPSKYPDPSEAVSAMLSEESRGAALLQQFIVVVNEPYHALGYPVCLVPEALLGRSQPSEAAGSENLTPDWSALGVAMKEAASGGPADGW